MGMGLRLQCRKNSIKSLFLAYVILSLSFERFLVSRVKELYKSLIPTTSYINSINQAEDIDILTSNLQKLNSHNLILLDMHL